MEWETDALKVATLADTASINKRQSKKEHWKTKLGSILTAFITIQRIP